MAVSLLIITLPLAAESSDIPVVDSTPLGMYLAP